MSGPVDVLAVIGNAAERLASTNYASELRAARAAVAELIEAAREVEKDAEILGMACSRLNAAIVRVGGAS